MANEFLSSEVLSSGFVPEDKKHLVASFITWKREVSGVKMETFQDFLDYASSPGKIKKGVMKMALHRHVMCVMFKVFLKNDPENNKVFWNIIPEKRKKRRFVNLNYAVYVKGEKLPSGN